MAHPQQHFFVSGVKQFLPDFFKGKRVLEIGSLNLNGSVREFFEGAQYIGLDIGEGRDVDIVCPGQDYGEKAESFDVVISCEAMEHNPAWSRTWLNMLRVTKPDGLVVMSCATTGRKQHGTEQFDPGSSPLTMSKGQNYYRNLLRDDFTSIVVHDAWFSVWAFFVDHTNHDLYFFGLGKEASSNLQEIARNLKTALDDYYYKRNVLGFQ
jgi:SAM-dependent methyltransferase